jgi:hypothetical protein
MMRNLWFISILVLFFSSCNKFICTNSHTENIAGKEAVSGLFDSTNVIKFHATINFKTSEMSGILVFKKINDSLSAGSFINEFGVKGFDFTISSKETKFSYLFKKLDKWYIRRSLGTDLHFLFLRPELQKSCSIDDKQVFVRNIKRFLFYVYYPVNVEKSCIADMYKGAKRLAIMEQSYNKRDGFLIKMRHTKGSKRYEFTELKN